MPRGKAGGSSNTQGLTDIPMRPTAAPRSVDISIVCENPRNLREDDLWTDEQERDETVASMKETGILQALLVGTREAFLKEYPEEQEAIGSAQYVILAGHRRLAAARIAGLEKVRIDVRDELIPDLDLVMLEENMKRKSLNVLQQGEGYWRLAEKGMSHAAIAKKVGKSKSTITKRIALRDLPDDAKQALLDKKLSVDTAYNLLVALGEDHLDKLLDAAAILRKDRNATVADAVNQVLAGGSVRTAREATTPSQPPAAEPVLTEPAEGLAATSTATLTEPESEPQPATDTAAVPAARREGAPAEPVLTEPSGAQVPSGTPAVSAENSSRAEAAAARNKHCALLVKGEDKPHHDPQTLRVACSFLTQATPLSLKRAHKWMVEADAPDADAHEPMAYRDFLLHRGEAVLIARLAYAVALAEEEIRAANRSRKWNYRDVAHLKHLVDTGYDPTEWDRQHLG